MEVDGYYYNSAQKNLYYFSKIIITIYTITIVWYVKKKKKKCNVIYCHDFQVNFQTMRRRHNESMVWYMVNWFNNLNLAVLPSTTFHHSRPDIERDEG